MKIRNVCPIGDLDIPLLRRVVAADEVVDVDPAHAAVLLLQRANYEPADDEARAVLAELDQAAVDAAEAAAADSLQVGAPPGDLQPPAGPGSGTSQGEGTDQQ